MAYQRPKLQSFTLPSVERPFIYKDPPKSVYTRQYQPVNEAEVLHNIRSSEVGQGRISEAIQYIARGTNPMTDVMYSNASNNGARTLHLPQRSATLPYKIEVVRPPLFTLDQLQAQSRQKYLSPAVVTNPVVPEGSVGSDTTFQFDRKSLLAAVAGPRNTNVIQAVPTLTYRIALPNDIFGDASPPITEATSGIRAQNKVLDGNIQTNMGSISTEGADFANGRLHREVTPSGAIVITPLKATNVSSGRAVNNSGASSMPSSKDSTVAAQSVKSDDQMLVLKNLKPNFQVLLNDETTRNSFVVPGTTQDKQTIAIQSALGTPLELYDRVNQRPVQIRDYQWKIIQTKAGSDALVLSIPASSNLTQASLSNLMLDSKTSAGTVRTNVSNQSAGVPLQSFDNMAVTHTKDASEMMNLSVGSSYHSAASEAHSYQGGSSMADRQMAASTAHLRKEARKARASDVRGHLGMHSSASMPTELSDRVLRLRKSAQPTRV